MKSYTLNIKGKILEINTPRVIGILNVTPDSFFDGGKFVSDKVILQQAAKMLSEGAAVLDIGGMSSRPGAKEIPEAEEMARVLPAIKALVKEFPEAILSVDTHRSSIAEAALDTGASMINDITAGLLDPLMFSVIAQHQCPVVLMHMQGTPADMQKDPQYKNISAEVFDFLAQRITAAKDAGIKDIILDPGFGFGKTVPQNYQLLKNIHIFGILPFPLLIGLSRKRMITIPLDTNAENALNGTTAAHMLALEGGAKLLRVHDVKEAGEAIKIWEYYKLA